VYVHDKISAKLGLILLEHGAYLLEHADEWDAPLLLMHGTADRICSYKASQEFAKSAGDNVNLVLCKDYYHETHNDIGKEKVISKLIHWLDERVQ
jgi:alpha-beta hydrolase superfamily lysophospholipase